MKKIITLVLAIALVFGCVASLASCSKQELNFGKSFSALDSQMDVLIGLNAKTIDVGVMDSVMAGYYMSQDSTYSDSLMIVEGLTLATEQYGIAARKGSGLTKKINQALIDLAKDGTVDEIADKYGLKSEICIDKNATVSEMTAAEKADWDYVVAQEKFIVGYTLFAPIAYEDNDGKLIGFDIELAKAVAEELDLDVEFKIINWNTKEAELESKTIDCIWNGMTITEERAANMAISSPYMSNEQVIITKADVAANYATAGSLDGKIVVAEAGSAGEELATTNEYFAGAEFIPVDTMAKAIMEVAAGTADACVVDYITALGMIGEGTDYADLAKVDGVEFAKEEYGIAFRKGSDMVEKVNAAIAELYADGTLADIAEWYNLGTQLIEQ